MTDVSGIPNMGFGGGAYYGGSGLNNAYANQAQTNNYLAQQQAQLAAANSYNPWANSGGSFGAQPAAYAYAGAAYGRAVPASSQAAVAAQNPSASVFDTGTKPFEHYGGVGGLQMFDPNKYLSQNRDVWEAGADPWQHYQQYGEKEGRQGAWGDFNSGGYLAQNPDIAASGMDPAAHWFQYGQKEGRQGSGLEPWFGASNQPAQPQQQQQLAGDWNSYFNTAAKGGGGAYTGRDALAAEYYLANPDVLAAANAAGGNHTDYALNHLMAFGDDEDRRFFDANAYLQQNPDVFAAGANPFQHYNQFGRNEGRAAPLSGTFDDRWYGLQNPDVLAAGMDPTAHWLEFGAKEGRAGGPEFNTSGYKDPWAAGIPQGRNSRDVLAAVLAASQSTGMSANALSALYGVESVWDPRANTKGNPNWGVPQLSEDMWGDAPFKGVINGKTWQQYRDGTAAEQIGVFADWLKRSGAMTRGGLDFAAQPEDMQFALLMANQLGGHYGMDWRNRIAGGDMTTPVYQGDKQAGELGNLSPQAFIRAYWDRVARWPTQQTNWGP